MKRFLIFVALCFASAQAVMQADQLARMREWRGEISFINQDGTQAAETAIWNPSTDPCTWQGVTCTTTEPQALKSINISPTVYQGPIMVGAWPNIDEWEFSGAFDVSGSVNITFNNVRLGPFLPSWMNDHINPLTDLIFRVIVRNPWSTVICNEVYDSYLYGDGDIWCSNLNVMSIGPNFGPMAGGNLVTMRVSGFARYSDIVCSFARFNEESIETYKVQPTFILSNYSWTSLDRPTINDNADANDPAFSTVSVSVRLWRTEVRCIAPPHPPGEVSLNLQWRTPFGYINITSFPLPYYYECPPGTFNRSVGVCEACPPGFFSLGGTATACTRCPAGSWNSKNGSAACDLCPTGTFSPVLGATNRSVCTDCPFATYNDLPGQERCSDCPAGTYTTTTGATTCPDCPAGSFSNVSRSENCTKCPPGSFQPFPGSTSCFFCPQASYSTVTGATVCTPCPPGETTDGRGAVSCNLKCPSGTYRPSTVTRCIPCAPGRFGATSGLALCSLCPVGTFANATSSTGCTQCPPDTVTIRAGQSFCQRIIRVQQPAERNGLVIGLVFIVLAIILVAIAIVYIVYKRKKQKQMKEEIELLKTEIGRLEKANGDDDAGANEYDSD